MISDSNGKYSPELFGKYKDLLLEAGSNGPVLVHCASAKRVGKFTGRYMEMLSVHFGKKSRCFENVHIMLTYGIFLTLAEKKNLSSNVEISQKLKLNAILSMKFYFDRFSKKNATLISVIDCKRNIFK